MPSEFLRVLLSGLRLVGTRPLPVLLNQSGVLALVIGSLTAGDEARFGIVCLREGGGPMSLPDADSLDLGAGFVLGLTDWGTYSSSCSVTYSSSGNDGGCNRECFEALLMIVPLPFVELVE